MKLRSIFKLLGLSLLVIRVIKFIRVTRVIRFIQVIRVIKPFSYRVISAIKPCQT
jgi:hypothetical protein